MICIHHNDLDGQCAAAIVCKKHPEQVHCFETSYNDPPPIPMLKDEDVVIVDFSYKPPQMDQVLKVAKSITWIDHHKTAAAYPYQHLAGLRDFEDKHLAGCELVWMYYYGEKAMPLAVRLIGDYDKWAHKIPESKPFYEGMKLLITDPLSPIWNDLLDSDKTVLPIVNSGRIAMKYRDNYCEKLCDQFGYQARFGEHLIFACNQMLFGSQGFGNRFYQYPFVAAYIHDADKFTVSLYSETVDVGEIAKAHGGGGHVGAAGFTCRNLPFTHI